MTLTPAQAVAQVDSPRHDWDELSDHYKRHCREVAAAAIDAHKVLEANVPLAPPEYMPPQGPPAEMRLPSGDVAYQTIRAGEVVPGMWVAAFRPFDSWRQVTAMRATGPDEVRFEYGYELETFELDDKVKVASTVDGARLAAERKAMQAEAYDTACEART